ncbi:MAG: helix-turn-helix transcriptional regulator [Lawsonibacter sp.]|nr:helix-turn-helix transcriptional regulator [Lawsonibacter sp.]
MFSSERLRQRRINMGMTQEEVGEIVGISRSGVQKHEKGIIKNVTTSTVELFAKALRCSPAYLMCWTDDPRIDGGHGDQGLDRLIGVWDRMNEEGRAKILEYADDIADKYSQKGDCAKMA